MAFASTNHEVTINCWHEMIAIAISKGLFDDTKATEAGTFSKYVPNHIHPGIMAMS